MSSYKKKILEARKKLLELTSKQIKQIEEIYAKAADRLIDDILDLPDISRTRTHDIDIARLLNEYIEGLYKELYPNITDNIIESSVIQRRVLLDYVDQVAKDRELSDIVKNNINVFSNQVVKTLIAGEYYKDGKTLSKRLWNITKENGNKIDEFIKMNIAIGANSRKLANDLEPFINPKKRLVSNNFKAGFDNYKISYQSIRLARTSISHAFRETQIQNEKRNPFNTGIKWELSSSHSERMHGRKDICDEYASQNNYGLGAGVYPADKLPLGHPNCLCITYSVNVSVDDAIARINRWVNGEEDPELEKWGEGYIKPQNPEAKKSRKKVDVDGENGKITVKVPKTSKKKSASPKKESKPPIKDKPIVAKEEKTPTKVIEFKTARTKAAAEKFVEEVLGIENHGYTGCDLKTINEWNRGLFDTFNRFPALKDKFKFVGECHERNKRLKVIAQEHYLEQLKRLNPGRDVELLKKYADKQVSSLMKNMSVSRNTFAQSWSPKTDAYKELGGITVNKDWGKDSKIFKMALKDNVESKFHPIGCDTIRSVLDHEIGHQLDDLLGIRELPEIQKLFDSRSHEEITEGLSKYSWNNKNKNKYAEFIAEGWAEYCNNPEPREIAKTIGETIERMYAEWEKKNSKKRQRS